MSKLYHNYANQYNKVSNPEPTVTEDEGVNTGVTVPEPENNNNPEPTANDLIYGTVVKCSALNVREEADINSAIVCVLPAGSKVVIENIDTAGEWFSVCTEAGLEGYCLSDYIKVD